MSSRSSKLSRSRRAKPSPASRRAAPVRMMEMSACLARLGPRFRGVVVGPGAAARRAVRPLPVQPSERAARACAAQRQAAKNGRRRRCHTRRRRRGKGRRVLHRRQLAHDHGGRGPAGSGAAGGRGGAARGRAPARHRPRARCARDDCDQEAQQRCAARRGATRRPGGIAGHSALPRGFAEGGGASVRLQGLSFDSSSRLTTAHAAAQPLGSHAATLAQWRGGAGAAQPCDTRERHLRRLARTRGCARRRRAPLRPTPAKPARAPSAATLRCPRRPRCAAYGAVDGCAPRERSLSGAVRRWRPGRDVGQQRTPAARRWRRGDGAARLHRLCSSGAPRGRP